MDRLDLLLILIGGIVGGAILFVLLSVIGP